MSRRLRSPAVVARADELAVLDRLRSEAAAGRGTLTVVRGEAGVGKSRLLAETVERARAAGAPVLLGRAVEGGSAFRPLADALLARSRSGGLPPAAAVEPFAGSLARLVPGWAAPTDPDPGADLPLLVGEALLRVLRVLDGFPAMLVLDDLHWADADTLTVLDRLADTVAEEKILVVLAMREHGPAALDRLAARAEHVLSLRRLAPDDAATLAAACAGDRPLPAQVLRHVVEHADGLPFFVEEILTGLVDAGALVATGEGWVAPGDLRSAVPSSVAGVVHSRLAALEPEARTVVETAAVLGRSVGWRLLGRVTGLPDGQVLGALRAAVERGLMVVGDEPDDVRFPHALTREAVLEPLLPPQRAALSRTTAAVVDELGGDPLLAAALHEQAGDPRRAARLLLQAADGAASGALGTREELLRRAADLAPEDIDVTVALVQVLALAGRAEEAGELGNPLLIRLPPGDPRRSALALVLARACLVASRAEDALGYLGEAGSGPAVDALASHVAFVRSRPDEADALARSAAGAQDPAVRCEALEMVGRVARLRDRPHEAETAFSRALSVAEEHLLQVWQVRAMHELGTLDMLGPARVDRLVAARESAMRTGLLGTAAVLDVQITAAHALRMQHGATLEAARRGIALAEQLRLPVLADAGRVFVATAQGHMGDYAAMHATLDEVEPRLAADADRLPAVRFARGIPALREHDLPALRATLLHGMEALRRNPSAAPSPSRGQFALLETALGDGAAEREELRRSGATVQAANRGALAYADAAAAARRGDDPGPHLAEAERVMEPLVWRRHHLRLLVAPAALRDGWSEPLLWLREAMAHFDEVGDAGLARACRQLLRAAGAPVPRRGRGMSVVPEQLRRFGVTSREADVLALVAQGLPNAAIAERLFLSPRTVETHIANLLAKTGAAGRADLVSRAAAL